MRSRFAGLVRHYLALWCTFTLFYRERRFQGKAVRARARVRLAGCNYSVKPRLYCLSKLKSNLFSTEKYFCYLTTAIARFSVSEKYSVANERNLKSFTDHAEEVIDNLISLFVNYVIKDKNIIIKYRKKLNANNKIQ